MLQSLSYCCCVVVKPGSNPQYCNTARAWDKCTGTDCDKKQLEAEALNLAQCPACITVDLQIEYASLILAVTSGNLHIVNENTVR